MQACGKCSAALIGARKFCASCGAPIEPPRAMTPPPGSVPQSSMPSAKPPSTATKAPSASPPSEAAPSAGPKLGPKGTVAFGFLPKISIPNDKQVAGSPAPSAGAASPKSTAGPVPAPAPPSPGERSSDLPPKSVVDPFASTTNDPAGLAAVQASTRLGGYGPPPPITRDMPHLSPKVDPAQVSPLAASAILSPQAVADARRASTSPMSTPSGVRGPAAGASGSSPPPSQVRSQGSPPSTAGSSAPSPQRALVFWSGQWLPGTVLNVHGTKCLVQFANGSQLWVESHSVKPA